jgi:hypothetical protein
MYQFAYYKDFDYTTLSKIRYNKFKGRGKRGIYNNAVMMFDTETSKSGPVIYDQNGDVVPQPNYVVAFTLSIRWKGKNICTLYGHKPSELMECINYLRLHMKGTLYIFCFNLAFDWVFLRKFFFRSFGYPKKQLCIKSHKPIVFEFENDIVIKDAYVLSGRKLEKWADDLDVEHKKAVGSWDYDQIRNQNHKFKSDELHYIECDTLAGVECIEATLKMLHKNISSIPYTVTGIVREEVRQIGEHVHAHNDFARNVPSLETQNKLEAVFHGGYTHGNRFFYGEYLPNDIVKGDITALDFTSSYPFIMLSHKIACGRYCELPGIYSINDILSDSKEYSFIFKFVAIGVTLKDFKCPMPYLQFSKCKKIINPILDNGRVESCDYCEIYINSWDLAILNDQYNFECHACVEVEYSIRKYLPRWYTDIVYDLFRDKCTLKNADPVLYALQKGKLNSLYGNCVTKPCRVTTEEDFLTGDYIDKEFDQISEYNKYINKRKNVLLYQWGVEITSIAAYNLFQLGKCVDYANGGHWLYSDTDSLYSNKWDMDKVKQYNDNCLKMLRDNGYEPVIYEGKEYIPGTAAVDGIYTEFCYMGAKRYAGRDKETGKLKITVAGVPKKTGAKCLKDDIKNFKQGFCFSGTVTGKLTHSYIYAEDIYIDKNGNEVADSIDLNTCNYILDQAPLFDWLETEYIEVNEYEQNNFR